MAPPSPALLERFNLDQRSSFIFVWARLPPHLREIVFDLHGPGWTPLAIEQQGDVLCEMPDVFSTSNTDFGSCALMPFEISVPGGSAPVTSRPHRINLIVAKEVEATLKPVPRGWADPTLDFTIFEPAGGHPEIVRGRDDHG